MKKLFTVLSILCCATIVSAAPYRESEFQSVYQIPRNNKIGFKNQMTLPLNYGDQYLSITREGGTMLSKIYIPPGTSMVSAFAYVTQGQGYVSIAIARFKQPPDIDSSWPASKDDLINIPNEPARISAATGKDYICRNSAGYLDIINDYGIRINNEGEAGWLYLIMKTFSPQAIISTPITQIVRSSIYIPWLNSKTDWAANGDPATPGQVIPTPTPVITPTPTITPVPPAGCGPTTLYLGDFGTWMWENGKWVRH